MRFANVAIPSPLKGTLTYAIPNSMETGIGMRVEVPFHRRSAIGLVIDLIDEAPAELPPRSIREISRILDEERVVSERMIELMRWMSSYYCAPIGDVLKASLPARLLKTKGPKTTRPTKPREMISLPSGEISLNPDQIHALEVIRNSLASPKTFLLHGITGSGKTEVYLNVFDDLVKRGKQGLLLVPEIGLTSQLTGRAAARFGDRIAVYHSGLTDAQRHEQWQRIMDGEVDVVIGTRSALFAPLKDLGAIVVDEEHDSSYKQDEGFSYHGRDSAVMRAHLEGIPAILGSATPSLESIANVRSGKYERLSLPSRTGEATLPEIDVVDMRGMQEKDSDIPEGLTSLSPRLYREISKTLDRGEQTLLYLGRRGFSAIHCEGCGDAIGCPNCNIALTSHVSGQSDRLLCHYCDYTIAHPKRCPSCGEGALAPIGHGTQRLEAEISDFFPKARIARLDSDQAASTKERHRIFAGMRNGDIDILVGTQMITKGHDFPGVTLVGVVSSDQTLHLPDFRAAERTFQLITQVAGRAGRADRPGTVIVQTFEPDHPSLMFSQAYDFDAFAEQELMLRESLLYPPFSRLANLRFSALDRELVSNFSEEAAGIARNIAGGAEGIRILGPAPAPLEKLRGRYRWHILIKAESSKRLRQIVTRLANEIGGRRPGKVRFSVDVDPTNLL